MRTYALFIAALSLVILGCMDCGGDPNELPPSPTPGTGGGGGANGPGISGTLTLFEGAQGASVHPPASPAAHAAFAAAREAFGKRAKNAHATLTQPMSSASIASAAKPPTMQGAELELVETPAGFGFPTRTELLPGEIIVRTEEVMDEAALLRLVQTKGLRMEHRGFATEHLHLVRFVELTSGNPLDVERTLALADALALRPGIRFTEVNGLKYAAAVPNDSLYDRQWHYAAMGLPTAWDVTQGASTVVVAVLDTGIVAHPDLSPRVLPGVDMVSDASRARDGNGRDNDPTDPGGDAPNGGSSWHGLHVAGTIGAASNNAVGVSGVDWAARIVPVRVLGKGGGTDFDIAAGMAWAYGATVPGLGANANPARVVNMSLGGGGQDPSPTYQDVIDTGVNQGVIFVIAAGNEDVNAAKTTPCNQANVICVGATGIPGRRASYSNFGAVVDVMAPGGEMGEDVNADGYPDGVLSTYVNASGAPSVGFLHGTSMAAPHVAGLVAMMKARNPALTHAQVEQILRSSANSAFTCSEGCGSGLVNAYAAVLAAGGQTATGPAKLVVASSELFLSGSSPESAVQLLNTGGASLTVTATASGEQASLVGFPGGNMLTLAAGKSAALRVRAELGSLPPGTHEVTLNLTSAGGSGQVAIRMRAGSTEVKDAAVVAVYLDGEEWKAAGTAVAAAASGHAYDLNLQPGVYFVLAAVDDDGDEEYFEEGERVGIWPLTSSPEPLEVPENTRLVDADFALVPFKPVESGGGGGSQSGIGGACGDSSQCESNDCITTWPGGYCSQVCTSSCASGSTCYTLTTESGDASICLANCASPGGGQSNCRSDYVCYPDADGAGYCWPRCTSNADCPGSCNFGTGYCQ